MDMRSRIRPRFPPASKVGRKKPSTAAQSKRSAKSTENPGDSVPKGYVIITEDIKDPAGMAEYAKLAGKALLSFDQKPEVLEGRWHGSQTVVLEFESVEAAREWYNSDIYQEAVK